MVRHAQFLSVGAVGVLRHAAVGELNAHRVVAQAVVHPRYTTPGIAHEGARGVVGEGVLLPGYAVEVRGARIRHPRGVVAHADEHVALVRHVEVIYQPEAVYVIDQPAEHFVSAMYFV